MLDFNIAASLDGVNFSPKSEVEEILQNVKTILFTVRGSVPLDRDFGISADLVDSPTPVVKARCMAEIVEAISKYEPRAKVAAVSFSGDSDGRLIPKVKVRIRADIT
ncbi:GPW/gp25 family protein [Aminobacterium sp. MB27-C1]|uniref:GPW/gp25 family protein n=1 Tax=Aminobacterium sp. MB27-C1 TaxID=3070661 RepID=UPI0027DB08ED|nr:GPW/gp25 family protein [Aminobacterium sp. MB27-C1]WMI72138.1 GPW/gp25 family protein [Aminobacterium sp. MB27-C1]